MGIEALNDTKQVPLFIIFNLLGFLLRQIILQSLNLANTFCDLFCHIYMSPDSHMKDAQIQRNRSLCVQQIRQTKTTILPDFH